MSLLVICIIKMNSIKLKVATQIPQFSKKYYLEAVMYLILNMAKYNLAMFTM